MSAGIHLLSSPRSGTFLTWRIMRLLWGEDASIGCFNNPQILENVCKDSKGVREVFLWDWQLCRSHYPCEVDSHPLQVAVIRDGRGAHDSLCSWVGPRGISPRRQTPSSKFSKAFQWWKQVADYVIERDIPYVRYEDLVVDPKASIAVISEWLGMDETLDLELLDPKYSGRHFRSGKVDSWRDGLPADMKEKWLEGAAGQLSYFGYSLD